MSDFNRDVHVRKLTEEFVISHQVNTRSQEIAEKAKEERTKAEAHVNQLTADFVAEKTTTAYQISETARNLMRVATGKDNDPALIERAIEQLKHYRHEPVVDAFFADRERAVNEKLFADRVAALKAAGLAKKIGGASETRTS